MHRIPVAIVKQKVSEATGIPLSLMLMGNKVPTARKREYVSARMISMTLSMKYSHKSLAYVGKEHGGRDHATTLHAVKTINNFLEIKDEEIVDLFNKSKKALKEWDINNNSKYNIPMGKHKCELIKYWIKHRVPLFVREQRLLNYGKYCSKCGNLIKETI
jgi:hypothetical protein